MSTPLGEITGQTLNIISPAKQIGAKATMTEDDNNPDISDNTPSSPFVDIVDENEDYLVKMPSPKRSACSPMAGKSPLKVLKIRSSLDMDSDRAQLKSPRKLSSPEKRFPVKVNRSPSKTENDAPRLVDSELAPLSNLTAQDQTVDWEHNTWAEADAKDTVQDTDNSIMSDVNEDGQDNFADETTFSNFSAVPDMTMFARIGHTPSKASLVGQTPRNQSTYTPATFRKPNIHGSSSPTLFRKLPLPSSDTDSDGTTNLLDFTEQFNNISHPHYARQRPPHKNRSPDTLSAYPSARTPSPSKRQAYSSRMSNLLDFDIPPAPTPRSLPSVTPRELEGIKSALLSEISSLKASLSGKEAEVNSLKVAVGDAEKRAGENMESLHQELAAREQLAIEKEEWERRGKEMESVLRNVKEEIVHCEREREELEGRLSESEKRREAAEIMAQDAESKMAAMKAAASSGGEVEESGDKPPSQNTGREVEIAVEKVARELHTLYKSKHETKVAALKKSYEARWDRRIKELEARIQELAKENDDLRLGRDATMSGVIPSVSHNGMSEELRLQLEEDIVKRKELETQLNGLTAEIDSLSKDNTALREELEHERLEKADLIAACDELLELQESTANQTSNSSDRVENLRGSISRASGLRPPAFGSSSSGDRVRAEKPKLAASQIGRPGSGMGMRSGMMSSIEKMGSHKSRPE
jgi:hypothetical protein